MANIMSQVKLKNHTSRDGFDLSRKNAFTAKVGELLPVACIECIPGDKFKARVQHFTRTMPVSTAAYTRIREYYDWFFVPTNLLWNKFNSFVTQMVDNNQHATSLTGAQVLTDGHPYFTTQQVSSYIQVTSENLENYKNMFGLNRGKLSAKLLNYLGYGDFTSSFADSGHATVSPFAKNMNLNPFPLLAYQKIYQDYYRHSQWESAYAPSFNIDYINGDAGSLNLPISSLYSTASAQQHENMFDLRYCNWNKDLFMGLLPNSQYGEAASLIFDGNAESTRPFGSMSMHAMNLPDSVQDDPRYIGIRGDVTESSPDSQKNLKYYYTIGVDDENGGVPGIYEGNFRFSMNRDSLNVLRKALGLQGFDILALRQAEALQKWKEVTQSQQQDYKNQIEAHFGVSPSDAYSERCKWIEGSVSNLDISEVTNQNLTADNSANIAGKGVGVGDGNMNFSTDVHGYLMCIYHAVPLLDYSITGINRMNLKTKVTDYAIPEFDQTGMVQVPTVELTNSYGANAISTDLLGYAPRYYDYKQAIDEVHGAFKNELTAWVAPVSDEYIMRYLANVDAQLNGLNYVFFKVNPATLNPIFGYFIGDDVDSDQLLVNAAFDIQAVRNLDRNGLPY